MAKKRSKKRTTRKRSSGRRRGRIGAIGGITFEQAAFALAGGFAGVAINKAAEKVDFVKKTPMIRPLVKGALAYYALQQRNPMYNDLAMGLLGETALDLGGQIFPKLVAYNPSAVSGIGATVIDLDEINGFEDLDTVAGVNDDAFVSGAL